MKRSERRNRRDGLGARGTLAGCGKTAPPAARDPFGFLRNLPGRVLLTGPAPFALLVLGGCAATLTPGEQLFRSGDFVGAVDAFRSEESQALYDPELKRMLAASWLRMGEPERAAVKLEEAIALAPEDPSAWFLLGEARTDLGDPEAAIQAYQQYLTLGGTQRSELRAKIARLSRAAMVEEVRATLAAEPGSVTIDSTLAVSAFLNVSGEEELASLSQGLAAVVITDLRKVSGFRVLERERLGVLLEELVRSGQTPGATEGAPSSVDPSAPRVGRAPGEGPEDPAGRTTESAGSDASIAADSASAALAAELTLLHTAPPPIDVRSAPRLGRLLRVRQFVQGFFTRLEAGRLLIGADVVSVEGKAEAAGAPFEGPIADVLYLEKGLVRQILATLGVAPSPEEERALDELLTGSPDAFFAWARGLRLLDLGRTAEAREAFHAAVVADPSFTEAVEAEELAAASEETFGEVRAEIWEGLMPEGDEPTGADGLIDVAVRLGGGPAPDGTGSGGDGDPDGLLGPSDPDRIDVTRRIPDLPPPPGGRR